MVATKEFTPIRKATMKELAPDFECKGSAYKHERPSGQIHCVRFTNAGAAFGGYYIDFGIHFGYMPSFKIYGSDHKAVHPDAETCALSCLLYTSPSPRDQRGSRMPSSA